ncbi:NUDIX domain-containing protein [Algoriphagus alkaliphilus]|uniref:NUDIX domain-containing protein n=1 Tax=Algoriphagus alkaliphilus TaxID=279824 RepID=A0A1G5ZJU0_9BACT|nr:NUDIX domain-containing protein [Algoriphagus alkaliphilus]MBA4299019.1 NUDIX domain-containing protein [Cyclobacterium sp.]SDA95108.1 NUDIX domain-containing protein [Algoriphagus alkaliphilus]
MPKDEISKEIEAKFGNQLRTRVNGILIENDRLLMVKHQMGNGRILWSVPGGGMNFGSTATENLKREYFEETHLHIAVGNYLFVYEYLHPPLHAMEHFFEVKRINGNVKLGKDPELSVNNQILLEISWKSISEINTIPNDSLHRVFWGIKSFSELGLWKGYFNFENISIK